jgi:class 3 adenylate cyclase
VLAYLEGLTPPHKGDCWPLDGNEVCMGRSGKRDNTISLTDKSVSREQARLGYSKGRFVLTAEAKCTVNGRPVEGKVVLRNGDLLGFGRQLLRFQSAQDSFGTGKGSIFFCDVWDYSKLFCDRAVQDVAAQMNEFYEVAGEAVEGQGGLVLRYVGDALLAAFSEIGHADAAVAAGISLQQRLLEKNQNWVARGLPALQVGVGISSGEFAMGHMGFGGYIEFGALGQDVNMAARIEKLTRDNGARILIAAATQELLREPLSTRSLGAFSLKGLEADVEVFEVLF